MRVSIYSRENLPNVGWRYLRVPLNPDGSLRRGQKLTLLKGKFAGPFSLRYRDTDGKQKWSLAKYPELEEAIEAQKGFRKTAEDTKDRGDSIAETVAKADANKLSVQIEKYCKELESNLDITQRTYLAYSNSLAHFEECCKKDTLDQITREDFLRFKKYLREDLKLSERTAYNNFLNVRIFLKWAKVEIKLNSKTDWPKKRVNDPEPYDAAEVKSLLKHSTGRTNLLIRTAVGTGCRKGELAHLTVDDIFAGDKVIRVQEKACSCVSCVKTGRWKPKTADSERDIPVSDVLLKDLLALKASEFLFATPDGKVDGHLDRDLGTVAKVAKVSNAKLHRFRDTFITNKIRDGVDIRTVQKYAGHTDVNVTMSYADWLGNRSKAAREIANREDDRYASVGGDD